MTVAAKSEIQIDNDEVRVTEWRLPPGSATGHHTHGMDYVVVPMADGEMTIVAPDGTRSLASSRPAALTPARPASNTMSAMNPQPKLCFSRLN